jgi:hypothetical protein
MPGPSKHGDIPKYIPAQDWTDETTTRIKRERGLPWGDEDDLAEDDDMPCLPCRWVHPADVVDAHALKTAILQELDGCTTEPLEPPTFPPGRPKKENGHRAEYCLHHIICCWNANLKWNQAAGPSFLIHILEGKYDGDLAFDKLVGNDRKVAQTVLAAKPKCAFQVFLAKMARVAQGLFMDYTNRIETLHVDRTEHYLRQIVQWDGSDFDIYPSVSEVDLLDEMYFEDRPPEKCINDDDTRASWMRTIGFDDFRFWVFANETQVLMIVPTIFIDEFLSQKSIDAIEEARLASLGFGVENDETAEASGQNVDTIQETIYTPSDGVSAQVSDQHADIIQDPNTSHLSSEESFEFEDEEAMIESAHELQSQLTAALPESPQPPMREEQ